VGIDCPGCGAFLCHPHFGCSHCDGFPPSPGFEPAAVCPHCEGDGVVGLLLVEPATLCPECGGSGEVPRTKEADHA
jgi:DnaJ-class molecular chaperone